MITVPDAGNRAPGRAASADAERLAALARGARHLALASYAALLVALTLEVFGIAALEPQSRAFLWAIFCLPLLVFLPGMLRGSWKTYLWLCFVLLVYFTVVVTNLFFPDADAFDWTELVLVCVLFVASMLFGRWRQRELQARED